MKLTPVKIPGKRRRKGESGAVITQKKAKPATPRSRPRPKKSAEETASYLEHMPLEILERIFWFSENVNLTRASPRIGRLLSGLPTRQATFINAFRPTWDACLGIVGPRRDIAPPLLANIPEPHEGSPEYQSDILAHSWADIDFILSCWDRYIVRRARWGLPGGHASTTSRFHIYQPSSPQEVTETMEKYSVDGDTRPSHDFWVDYRVFRDLETWEQDDRRDEVDSFFAQFQSDTFYHVNANARIPEKLLFSTDNENDLQKLFWLVRGGANLATDQDWELTQEAFHAAIKAGIQGHGQFSYSLIGILFILGAPRNWPEHVRFEAHIALQDLDPDSELGGLRRYQHYLDSLEPHMN
ncbi:hypothetical protein F5B19DRAFT_401318 [Rostrohypoxylon terebratum]|nr:hypothetical protein F5B19DRAFT_401318 [Rostrohypoxylon terebratum]